MNFLRKLVCAIISVILIASYVPTTYAVEASDGNFMAYFTKNTILVNSVAMDFEAYKAWQKVKMEQYSKCALSDKVYEELDRLTFIMRRNEMDRQKLQRKLEEKGLLNNNDDEQ